jgi:hypothetical protein
MIRPTPPAATKNTSVFTTTIVNGKVPLPTNHSAAAIQQRLKAASIGGNEGVAMAGKCLKKHSGTDTSNNERALGRESAKVFPDYLERGVKAPALALQQGESTSKGPAIAVHAGNNHAVEASVVAASIQLQIESKLSSKDHFAKYVQALCKVASCNNETDGKMVQVQLVSDTAKLHISGGLLIPDKDAPWANKSDWLVQVSRLYITEPRDARNLTEEEARVLLECHNLVRFQDSTKFLMALAKEGDRGPLSDCVAHGKLDIKIKITGITLMRLWSGSVPWGSTEDLSIRVASANCPRKNLQVLLELSFRYGSY